MNPQFTDAEYLALQERTNMLVEELADSKRWLGVLGKLLVKLIEEIQENIEARSAGHGP